MGYGDGQITGFSPPIAYDQKPITWFFMETFSRVQQVVVLLMIFGMTLLYFHSINQPNSRKPALSEVEGSAVGSRQLLDSPIHRFTDHTQPAANHQSPTTNKLSGAQLLTLNKPLNINTATAGDLEAIPGIGLKTAERIVAYRKKHGGFAKIEDIMKVPGIKEKRFEKIKRHLTIK
jgi:competence protein ComEA